MGRVNKPQLTVVQRDELEQGFTQCAASHCFRMRCHAILLKAEGRKSKEVGELTGMCALTVNNWVARYKDGGIDGLYTKPGRGRKPAK
ncbi:MAG: helix-turn-helix domain-containing protein [Dysgonamonadaceae bacterium]|jgi:transposase|nr:helix-turn-helix domain-containing protein [Dysgonamonadaceae bacterium]